ncbi:penicillin-binding protein 1A/1B [Gracilibacillus halophilus YIM-C55.5]|uniref:Penicillin-binding protein 1A/1B n=1 Tax=Gracilibacillus halophilus YIM-C55.5 TaxID=1308866 RepID=N4WDG6_9BACI|nr:penicillin-binding protein 1A [Gracilibacillus halophilus]ENH97309.1 penicillin-binding protein 1A/1B [Gracilibacillus halophilus YIM-C55.5]
MANKNQSRIERRKQKQQSKQKKPMWKRIIKIAMLCVLLIGIGFGALFTYYIATAPDINADKLSAPASTKLYDTNGEQFANLGTEKRTKIDYDDLPPVLLDAIIATEDARFKDHIGIDFRRIGAAVIANFRNGFGSQGASTITQQVVKRAFLSNDKRLKRKVQEQWLALKLDRQYSKQEIMEMYVNEIYYGSGAYGVATASEVYFDKELNELTLAEAAILAGLPQRPTAYDPFVNPDLAKERMNTVLDLMVQHNKITQDKADEARNVDISSLLTEKTSDFVKYEGFIQQVRDEVMEKTGADIYKDSLNVYTTLDPNAQEHVEFLLSNKEDNPIDYSSDEEMQVGLTVVDTQTGAIRAIGGGRNREQNGWNYAIDGNGRQGGSTMKPVVSYGPAIENLQWSTYHQLNDDEPYPIEGTNAVIENYNHSYQGWMTARYALKESLNVPAVKTLEAVGYSKAQSFAEGLGIEFATDPIKIGDAIGGTGTGVLPIEMAGAYAAFGNGGTYNEPYAVTKIEYTDENRTEEYEAESSQAMEDYTSYMITDMLQSVVQSGTGTRANVSGVPIAGKTGTTNLEDINGSPDSWFTGYSTNYTISVWTGYERKSEKEEQKVIQNTKLAQDIFRETMAYISQDEETANFEQPDSVVEADVEKGSRPAKRPSEYTPESEIVTELFVEGNEPSEVSEKYDQPDPVENLQANYSQEDERISVSWEYDSEDETTFDVSAGTGESMENITTTEETQTEIRNVEQGETYTIEVVAIQNDTNSEPVTVTVNIPEDEPEKLPAVQSLNQNLNPEDSSVLVSWEYQQEGPITFDVTINENGNMIDEYTTNNTSLNISELQANRQYTITVTPRMRNDESIPGEPASIQLSTENFGQGNNNENNETDEESSETEDNQSDNNSEDGQNPEDTNDDSNQNGTQTN